MRVWGQTYRPHVLERPAVHASTQWRVATSLHALKTNAQGCGSYAAANYDELADAPVEMSDFWSGEFTSKGVPHRVVVTGAAPSFDCLRLLADMQATCVT